MEPTYVQTRTPGNFPSKRESEHEWSEHLDGFSTFNSHTRIIKDHPVEICWDMFEFPLLLVLIGILSAFTSYFVSFIVNYGNTWRWSLVHDSDDFYSWALYCVWCLGFALLASFVTQTICKESAGSGLPEMKTILSGVIKPVLLSLRLIVAKLTGLSFALISGLSVGKEGPFVQIAGAIADQLMKLPVFRHVRCQDTKRLEVIACAAASGVCVTFGTAFGAVLFSIEFTSSAYLVKTLPKALLTAACSMIVILWLGITQKLELFDENITSENKLPTMMEIAGFVVIGIISGLLGVLFVTIVEFISSLRNQFLDSTKHSRSVVSLRAYLMVGIVSLLTSIPMYYELSTFPESSGGSRTLLDVLFQKADLKRVYPFLFPYFVYKFIATALSVTLPLPVGLFTPVFLTGGILGRIIGKRFLRQFVRENHRFISLFYSISRGEFEFNCRFWEFLSLGIFSVGSSRLSYGSDSSYLYGSDCL
jgi:chloride channel 2